MDTSRDKNLCLFYLNRKGKNKVMTTVNTRCKNDEIVLKDLKS